MTPSPRRSFLVQGIAKARLRAGELARSADVQQRVDGYWHPRGEDIARQRQLEAAYVIQYHREQGWR